MTPILVDVPARAVPSPDVLAGIAGAGLPPSSAPAPTIADQILAARDYLLEHGKCTGHTYGDDGSVCVMGAFTMTAARIFHGYPMVDQRCYDMINRYLARLGWTCGITIYNDAYDEWTVLAMLDEAAIYAKKHP